MHLAQHFAYLLWVWLYVYTCLFVYTCGVRAPRVIVPNAVHVVALVAILRAFHPTLDLFIRPSTFSSDPLELLPDPLIAAS
jgi:hypothetical protein